MDLLGSYHSDSDGKSDNEEYSDGICSTGKFSKYSHEVDYFCLNCSSSDDEGGISKDDQKNIAAMALILSDVPYKPEKPTVPHQNSYQNFAQNTSNTNSPPSSLKRLALENDIFPNSVDTQKSKSVLPTLPIQQTRNVSCETDSSIVKTGANYITLNISNSVGSNKKLKYLDEEKNYSTSCYLSSTACHNNQPKYSVKATDKHTSGVKVPEQIENHNLKSVPSGLPKKCVKSFYGHSRTVSALKWCVLEHSNLLLSASLDSSVKVWDVLSRKMVQNIEIPSSKIKAAQWMQSGTSIICGGFDKKARIFDVSSGKEMMTYSFCSHVSSIEVHPSSQHLFVAGVKDKVLAFDMRNNLCEPVRAYEAKCGQILDVKFLEDGNEFVCSSEIVSSDSADRTIMAWDFTSGALLSNQIFQERYTCPFLQVNPSYKTFVAQTNGNYIAMFSTQRPYKMNKNKRYEGHKVLGYPINCDYSPNGKFLASGDAEGGLFIYWSHTALLAERKNVKPGVPTAQVKWHPHLRSTIAVSSWDGEVQLWQ